MARKSGDGSPGAKNSELRPGSYAKVSSSRGRRQGRKQRRSSAAPPPASRASAEPRPTGGAKDDEREPAFDDVVDSPRVSKVASDKAPKRALGPLGMDEVRPHRPTTPRPEPYAEPAEPVSRAGSEPARTGGARARMNVVEINAPQPALDEPCDESEPFGTGDLGGSDEQPRGRGEQPTQPPDEVSDDSYLPRGDDIELARPLLSSVLGARVSFRPSPPPPPERLPTSWWLLVATCAAIIGAAGLVALRERGPERAETPDGPGAQAQGEAAPAAPKSAHEPISPLPAAPIEDASMAAAQTAPDTTAPQVASSAVQEAPTVAARAPLAHESARVVPTHGGSFAARVAPKPTMPRAPRAQGPALPEASVVAHAPPAPRVEAPSEQSEHPAAGDLGMQPAPEAPPAADVQAPSGTDRPTPVPKPGSVITPTPSSQEPLPANPYGE